MRLSRRAYLASITGAVGGAASVAGCQSSGSENVQTDVPADQIGPGARFDQVEIAGGQLMAKEYLRYYDKESGEIEKLQAENGWWYLFTIEISHLGGPDSASPLPRIENIHLYCDGQSYDVHDTMPKIDWEQIRLRDNYETYWLDPESFTLQSTIEGGDSIYPYFIADAAPSDDPLVEIQYRGGHVFLEEAHIHTPRG